MHNFHPQLQVYSLSRQRPYTRLRCEIREINLHLPDCLSTWRCGRRSIILSDISCCVSIRKLHIEHTYICSRHATGRDYCYQISATSQGRTSIYAIVIQVYNISRITQSAKSKIQNDNSDVFCNCIDVNKCSLQPPHPPPQPQHFGTLSPLLLSIMKRVGHNWIKIWFQNTEETNWLQMVLLSQLAKTAVWSKVLELFNWLGLPRPLSVQSGCIRILMNRMTPNEAQALLSTYHDGKLEEELNKVCNCSGLYTLVKTYFHY